MSDVFKDYLTTAFGEPKQADFKIAQFKKNYKRFFPQNKAAAILDIGPGRGELLTCLSALGYTNLQGVDISASIADFCTKLGYNIHLVDDTFTFLSERPDAFDMITLCDVLEHIPKDRVLDFLQVIKKSLKTDGTLIIQVPNMQSPIANLHMYGDFTHEVGYTEHSLNQILLTSGFTTFEFGGFEYLDDSFKSILHKFFRRIYWFFVFVCRKINGNYPHKLLHPVFYAIVKK